jgi:ribonuclease HII
MVKRIDPSLLPPSPNLSFEEKLWKAGIKHIAGVDEAGRGALAGPVAAAAVILPPIASILETLHGLDDSKQLSPVERTAWADNIRTEAAAWGIGFASHEEIDLWGIIPATRLAAHRAMEKFEFSAQHLLLDYLFLPDCDIPQTSLVKGDARSLSIAAASVLAKTARDALLIRLESEYPGYRFSAHKGYGTPQHLAALHQLGPSEVHRMSFAPLKDQGETTQCSCSSKLNPKSHKSLDTAASGK